MGIITDKILKESFELNEFLGFSKQEKEKKALQQEILKAKDEISKFKLNTLVGQTAGNTPEEVNNNTTKIISYRLRDAKTAMPTVATLVPQLFQMKPNSTNAMTISYKNMENIIFPSAWSFCITNHELDPNKFKITVSKLLDNLQH